MADTPDLGSGAARLGGSSPPSRIQRCSPLFFIFTLVTFIGCAPRQVGSNWPEAWCRDHSVASDNSSSFIEYWLLSSNSFRRQHENYYRAAARRLSDIRSLRGVITDPTSPDLPLDGEESLRAPSTDGTFVPISVVRPSKPVGLVLIANESNGIPTRTTYSPYVPALLKSGIAVAIAHIRGSAEPAPSLRTATLGSNEERSIEDLVAAARELSARGYTSPRTLILEGRSAGGWLAASAALSRPELFRGLILDGPVLDPETSGSSPELPSHPREESESRDHEIITRSLSPLDRIGAYYPLDTLVLLPSKTPPVPSIGTLEWARRVRCVASPEASIIVKPNTTGHDEDAELKIAFVLSTLLGPER